jgi:hypothetical protein
VHGTGDGFDGLTADYIGQAPPWVAAASSVRHANGNGSGSSVDDVTVSNCDVTFHAPLKPVCTPTTAIACTKGRVLVEVHHKWAQPAPLVTALRAAAASGLMPWVGGRGAQLHVWLKHRWAADVRQSGSLLPAGATAFAATTALSAADTTTTAETDTVASTCTAATVGGGAGAGADADAVDVITSTTTPNGDGPDSAATTHPEPLAEATLSPAATSPAAELVPSSAVVCSELVPSSAVVCSENGLKFALSLAKGEHIGLFLDSRSVLSPIKDVISVLSSVLHRARTGLLLA